MLGDSPGDGIESSAGTAGENDAFHPVKLKTKREEPKGNNCNFECMVYHVLNGDALAQQFPVTLKLDTVLVIREAFIDGPLSLNYTDEYWNKRKEYIENTYEETQQGYQSRVMSQFRELEKIRSDDQVYLWFEDDLFCQCNMWFAVDYISKYSQPQFHRVFPKADIQHWRGFGIAEPEDLIQYFHLAIDLSTEDIVHIQKLWKALVESNPAALIDLSKKPCAGIRFQNEVILAHLEREPDESGQGRPGRALKRLMLHGEKDFYKLFQALSEQEGIYGFSDTQVKNMLKLM